MQISVAPAISPPQSPILGARVGSGTVGSHFDRAISIRLEGSGAPSQRTLIAQTSAAANALASPAGPALERMIRRAAAVADGSPDANTLRSYTFAPDDDALKATMALGDAAAWKFQPTSAGDAQRFVDEHTETVMRDMARTLAFNGGGDVVLMPDVSRELLATIGAYRLQAGDQAFAQVSSRRAEALRDDWDTLLHESNHSVTPQVKFRSTLVTAWEEAIATVLARRDRSAAAQAAGATIDAVAADPAGGRDDAQLGWSAWNRRHLPKPPEDEAASNAATYDTGPATLRKLLNLAGVDRRTTAGRQQAIDLLQSVPADDVPAGVTDAIIARQQLAATLRPELERRVRASVTRPEGIRWVTDWIARQRSEATESPAHV